MATFSWWSWFFGVAAFCTAAAYIVVFVYAIGLWDGQSWITVRQFAALLMSAAIAEFAFGTGIVRGGGGSARPGPFFVAAAIRHMIIAVLSFYLYDRAFANGGRWPSGFGDSPNGTGNVTHAEVRETMRMTVIVAACIIDCFITLAGLGSGATLVVTKWGKKSSPGYTRANVSA